jgi:putative PLP-dependent aminotransferase (TIGR04422 family)
MPKKSSDGVWGKRKKYKISLTTATAIEIEELLSQKFLGGFPVILSSGRGAIKLIVQEFWAEKDISVFQYASQCVVEAIQAAGVTPFSSTNFTSQIVYNQWGQLDLACETAPFMEDSCDTFLPEGSSVLRLGAQFEIWSLPKILESRFGAVVWCRDSEDAINLRRIRDLPKGGNFRKQILRNFRKISKWNYKKWEASEFKTVKLSKYEYASILQDVSKWSESYYARQELKRKAYIFLCESYPQYFESPIDSGDIIQNPAGPVVYLDLKNSNPGDFLPSKAFQVLHKIANGKRPQKVLIYKFLHDGCLK